MASLYDVARLAGVSKTLVSRVVNEQHGVSEKSRQKILLAMKELQYKPNELARSLVLKKTHTLGVVMDTLCEAYFFDLIDGIEREADQTDYDVVFCSGRNKASLKNRYIKYFSQGRADGVIIYGSHLDDEAMIEQMAQTDLPFVVVENDLSHADIHNIVVDNEFGAKLAVDHLVECGCRRIFHVSGDANVKAALDRRNGYIIAMQRQGFTVTSEMILQADFTLATGYRVMEAFLRECPASKLPDAMFCGSDNTAYGVMMALQEAGIRIPEDVMVVGFDDDRPPNGEQKLPKLTTLSQPLFEMGKASVRMLLNEIEEPTKKKQRLVYYPELIVKETTVKK